MGAEQSSPSRSVHPGSNSNVVHTPSQLPRPENRQKLDPDASVLRAATVCVDPCFTPSESSAPTRRTTQEPSTKLHQAARRGDLGRLYALLGESVSQGIDDVNDADASGRTALHHAAIGGSLQVAKALVGAKADVSVRDKQGKTPLNCAAETQNADVLRYLVDVKGQQPQQGSPSFSAGSGLVTPGPALSVSSVAFSTPRTPHLASGSLSARGPSARQRSLAFSPVPPEDASASRFRMAGSGAVSVEPEGRDLREGVTVGSAASPWLSRSMHTDPLSHSRAATVPPRPTLIASPGSPAAMEPASAFSPRQWAGSAPGVSRATASGGHAAAQAAREGAGSGGEAGGGVALGFAYSFQSDTGRRMQAGVAASGASPHRVPLPPPDMERQQRIQAGLDLFAAKHGPTVTGIHGSPGLNLNGSGADSRLSHGPPSSRPVAHVNGASSGERVQAEGGMSLQEAAVAHVTSPRVAAHAAALGLGGARHARDAERGSGVLGYDGRLQYLQARLAKLEDTMSAHAPGPSAAQAFASEGHVGGHVAVARPPEAHGAYGSGAPPEHGVSLSREGEMGWRVQGPGLSPLSTLPARAPAASPALPAHYLQPSVDPSRPRPGGTGPGSDGEPALGRRPTLIGHGAPPMLDGSLSRGPGAPASPASAAWQWPPGVHTSRDSSRSWGSGLPSESGSAQPSLPPSLFSTGPAARGGLARWEIDARPVNLNAGLGNAHWQGPAPPAGQVQVEHVPLPVAHLSQGGGLQQETGHNSGVQADAWGRRLAGHSHNSQAGMDAGLAGAVPATVDVFDAPAETRPQQSPPPIQRPGRDALLGKGANSFGSSWSSQALLELDSFRRMSVEPESTTRAPAMHMILQNAERRQSHIPL